MKKAYWRDEKIQQRAPALNVFFLREPDMICCIWLEEESICAMVKSRYIGDGHPIFNRKSL